MDATITFTLYKCSMVDKLTFPKAGTDQTQYYALQGKPFPYSNGPRGKRDYGETYFFDNQDLKAQLCDEPFAQGSTLEVTFDLEGFILEVKVIKEGRGQKAVRKLRFNNDGPNGEDKKDESEKPATKVGDGALTPA